MYSVQDAGVGETDVVRQLSLMPTWSGPGSSFRPTLFLISPPFVGRQSLQIGSGY